MPVYTYECESCSHKTDAVRSIDDRYDTPKCKCGGDTKKIITPTQIAPMFQSYKAVAGDGRMIHSKQQHKNFLSENNLQEVGTERLN
jgi:putative FmdB family regulatory protein